ncbi:hypothetical protein CJD36_017950 [Flavipsychrobacter stenotrophus]|uniref:Uncharacterized protein n=2 Tax=Flavipsychrobacter stenotrophus TaxID=2077091 RepID=A0A2S7SSB4_9BACT|nr:hypothetical protein CJD36_017950 [Flavipsychrobacter stenotrophus]
MGATKISMTAFWLGISILTGCTKMSNSVGGQPALAAAAARNFVATGTASDAFSAFFPVYTVTRTDFTNYTITYPDDTTFTITGKRYYIEMGNYYDTTTANLRSVTFNYTSKSSADSTYMYDSREPDPSFIRIKNDTLYIHFHSGSGCSEYSEVSDFAGKINKL